MKKNIVLVFLGIAVVLSNYLGFHHPIKSVIIITLGLAVSFISFRGIVKDKFLARTKKGEEKNDILQKNGEKTLS